jgi:signal transduction histidine kinase
MTEALTLKDQLLEAATALHEPSPRSEPPRSVPKQDALANFGRYMGRILGRLKEAAQRGAEHLNCGYSSLAGAYFTQIHEEIDDALGAVRLAKQYTRVNLEGSCARIASFDLNEAVIDAIHSVSGASAISEETTCVAPRFFPVENCITHGDKREIMYVVAHLLENSYRASGGKGGVTLRTQTENGCALLHIQDGAGPGDVLGFESQWSLRVSHIGVGLELISSILKRYGGGISVRTLDGAGWTFTLKLPRVAHDESAAEPACSPEEDERNTDGAL